MRDTQKRAKAVGIAAIIFGLAGVAFCVMALGMVAQHHAMIARAPFRGGNAEAREAIKSLHQVWLAHVPLWLVMASYLGVQGFRLVNVRSGAAARARLVCWAGLAAFCAYGAHVMLVVVPAWEPLFTRSPMLIPYWHFMISSLAVATVGVATPSLGMLIGLCGVE